MSTKVCGLLFGATCRPYNVRHFLNC